MARHREWHSNGDSWSVERCVSLDLLAGVAHTDERQTNGISGAHTLSLHPVAQMQHAASNWPVWLGGSGLKFKFPSLAAVLASQTKQLCLLMALWLHSNKICQFFRHLLNVLFKVLINIYMWHTSRPSDREIWNSWASLSIAIFLFL